MTDFRGIVGVVGGGAAGISAATWLRSLHVESRWWVGDRGLGGMLRRVNNPVANFPPQRWEDGDAVATALAESVAAGGLELLDEVVTQVEPVDGGFAIETNQGTTRVGAVILATGTRYRSLGIPGEAEGLDKWVSQSAARDAPRFAGRQVLVVGGGDAAFENALRLAEAGASVKLAARSSAFRARNSYVENVRANEAIEILPVPTTVTALKPTDNGCIAECESAGLSTHHEVACVFVRIGVEPVVPEVSGTLSVDDRGFVVVDQAGATSIPGLFAAGDVTSTNLRSVATSTGDGARCARSAAEFIGSFYDH